MLVFLILLFATVSCLAEEVLVDIPSLGIMKGTTGNSSFSNRNIFQFTGIPYAESPVESLRFKRPIKKQSWGSDVLDATQYGNVCPQPSLTVHRSLKNVFKTEQVLRDGVAGSEDCLVLDVYTPQLNGSFPVLFYIHGGSFIEGTSQKIKPGFLLEHDMVLVAPQYRLGPLGFMVLENDTGNAAMFDLVMALDWVRDNIEYLGGDRNKITISGISAGAAAAALLYVSPLTQDKFAQVMLLSGSAVAPWVVDSEPMKHSGAIADFLRCEKNETYTILECLQSKNPSELVTAYLWHSGEERKVGNNGMGGSIPFVDGEFLPASPQDIMMGNTFEGRPMVMSTTRHEGIFLTDTMYQTFIIPNNLANNTDVLKYNITDILMGFTNIEDPSHIVGPLILESYFDPRTLGDLEKMKSSIVDFNGAAYFKGPAQKMAELNSLKGGKTFLISFGYDPEGTGVNHAADQRFLFPWSSSYSEADLNVVKQLTEMYSCFVIHGTLYDSMEDDSIISYSRENSVYLAIDGSADVKTGFEQEFAITENERRRSTGSAGLNSVPSYFLLVLLSVTLLVRWS